MSLQSLHFLTFNFLERGIKIDFIQSNRISLVSYIWLYYILSSCHSRVISVNYSIFDLVYWLCCFWLDLWFFPLWFSRLMILHLNLSLVVFLNYPQIIVYNFRLLKIVYILHFFHFLMCVNFVVVLLICQFFFASTTLWLLWFSFKLDDVFVYIMNYFIFKLYSFLHQSNYSMLVFYTEWLFHIADFFCCWYIVYLCDV